MGNKLFHDIGVHVVFKNPYKRFPWLENRLFYLCVFVKLPKHTMLTRNVLQKFDDISKTIQKPVVVIVNSHKKLEKATKTNLLANGIDYHTIAVSVSFFHKNNLTFVLNRQLVKKVS